MTASWKAWEGCIIVLLFLREEGRCTGLKSRRKSLESISLKFSSGVVSMLGNRENDCRTNPTGKESERFCRPWSHHLCNSCNKCLGASLELMHSRFEWRCPAN